MFSIGSKKSLNHSMLKAIWSKNAAGRVGLFWAPGQAKSKVPSLAISNIHALAWCSIWMFLVFLVPWWQQACQIVQCLKCSIMPSKKNNQVIGWSTHPSSTRGTWWRCWWISNKGLHHETMELVTSMETVIAKHPITSCTVLKRLPPHFTVYH